MISDKNPVVVKSNELFKPFKIVITLENEKGASDMQGWKKVNNQFVYYDTLTESKRDKLASFMPTLSSTPSKPDIKESLPKTTCESATQTDRVYKCPYCFLPFLQARLLINHLRESHSNSKQIEGPTTNRPGISLTKSHHHWKDVGFKCDICEKIFKEKRSLTHHAKFVHSTLRPFKCKLCPKTYKHQRDLNCHVQTLHVNPQGHRCGECNKRFYNLSALKRHLQNPSHKIRKCDFCQETFMERNAFYKHLNCHPEALTCDVCKTSFAKRIFLKEHLRYPSVHKPLKCDLCSETFLGRIALKKHLIHHSETISCAVCRNTFANEHSLRRHLQNPSVHKSS